MLFLYYETAAEKRLESSGCGLLERKRVAWEKAAVEKMIEEMGRVEIGGKIYGFQRAPLNFDAL